MSGCDNDCPKECKEPCDCLNVTSRVLRVCKTRDPTDQCQLTVTIEMVLENTCDKDLVDVSIVEAQGKLNVTEPFVPFNLIYQYKVGETCEELTPRSTSEVFAEGELLDVENSCIPACTKCRLIVVMAVKAVGAGYEPTEPDCDVLFFRNSAIVRANMKMCKCSHAVKKPVKCVVARAEPYVEKCCPQSGGGQV